jgi:tyrosine-protein kinase Etk/Wzc
MNNEIQNYTRYINPPPQQMEEVHLQDYLNVLFRRRKAFLITFVSVFVLVALYTFIKKPVYEATATLHVKDETGKGELGDVLELSSSNPVEAELEILKSRTNAEKVVNQLHLDWKISGKPDDVSFRILEFTSTAEEPSYQIELTGKDGYSVTDSDGNKVGAGHSGTLMRGKGISLLLADLRGNSGDTFKLDHLPFNATVAGLRNGIKADQVGKKANIMSVAYDSTDPVLARDVVNTLVQAYLEQSVGFKTEEAGKTVGFVENQLQGLRKELDSSEKNLEVYKSASGVVMLDPTAENLIQELSDTEKARTDITLKKKGVEFALASLKDARRRGATYSPAVTQDDPLIAGMASRLAELEVQKSALLADSTEQHPAVKAVKEQIDEIQRKIQFTYENAIKDLSKQEAEIGSNVARYEGMLKGLPVAERDLARLTRLSKVNSDIYTFLLQKHEEARIAKASTISNINIVDPAIIQDEPVKPKKLKNLLLGLIVGCMIGVGLAFFMEYLDDTIKDADGAKRELGWPLLAVTPHIRNPNDTRGEHNNFLLTHLEPKSQAAEAFRSVRTGIHFSSVNRDNKVILITSTFPGEGKSTVGGNLACILTQTGAGVVLVDCDLRRSSLHEKLGFERENGLTDVLAGDMTVDKVLKHTRIPGLDFISSGITPPNPAELLGSRRMKEMMATLRDKYDTIIIDAPPVLAVTDAQLLTAISDMVVVVIEAGRVPVKAARQMREMLESVNAPVAGMILNDKTGKGSEHYGYGYHGGKYYGYYGYGYGYYSEPKETRKKPLLGMLKRLPGGREVEKSISKWRGLLEKRKI